MNYLVAVLFGAVALSAIVLGILFGEKDTPALTPAEQQAYHEGDYDEIPAYVRKQAKPLYVQQVNEVLAAIEERNREAEWL